MSHPQARARSGLVQRGCSYCIASLAVCRSRPICVWGQHDQLLWCVIQSSLAAKILRVPYLPGVLSVGIKGDSCYYGATTRELSTSLLHFICILNRSDYSAIDMFLASMGELAKSWASNQANSPLTYVSLPSFLGTLMNMQIDDHQRQLLSLLPYLWLAWAHCTVLLAHSHQLPLLASSTSSLALYESPLYHQSRTVQLPFRI